MTPPRISVIIPCCNEAGNLEELTRRLVYVLSGRWTYELIFVDDGSTDGSSDILRALHSKNQDIHYLEFSRNFGHQNALRAGLDYASGDAIIMMDADLQHPPELIPELIKKREEGYEVVYTLRNDAGTPLIKRVTASLFYKLIKMLTPVRLEAGSADFRLLDKKAVNALRAMDESHLFYRGMIPWIGFRQCAVPYVPHQRIRGETKYTFWRMTAFALNGISSFSTRPLHLSTWLGFLISVTSFLYAVYAICQHMVAGKTIPGWTSVIVCVLFIGGLQLLMLGIMGEYLGKMFMQAKKRPNYIIREASKLRP